MPTPNRLAPRPAERLVRRPRLEVRLAAGDHRTLTLVSAPPGTGKSTLLAAWAAEAVDPCAWMTVEPRDNEEGRFAKVVTTALVDLADAGSDLSASGLRGLDLLDAALCAVASRGLRCTIVLDDVHELTAGEALGALAHLAEHAPPRLRIVLATRADPPLRIGRLRASGRLAEVRGGDLAFSRDEAAQLLAAHGLRLGARDVDGIHRLTEGWAAGLALLASALEDGADPRGFAHDLDAAGFTVADYLVGEVLARQPPEVRNFLLQTSVVDRLTPELAQLLSDRDDAGAELARLERRGLFLTRLDTAPVYRYHALFAALLRAILRHEEPARHAELHARAARWYAARDLLAEADAHARRAGDWELLGSIVEARWLHDVRAGRADAAALVDGVPPAPVRAVPRMARVAAAAACDRLDRDAFIHLAPAPDGAAPEPATAALVLQLLHGRAFGADPEARAAAQRLAGDADRADPALRRVARLYGAELRLDDGDLTGVQQDLEVLLDAAAGDWTSDVAIGLLALVHALEGRLRVAEVMAERGVVGRGAAVRTSTATAALLATALVGAQRGDHARGLTAVRAADATSCSHPVRMIHKAVRAVLMGGRTVSLDGPTARHPAAAAALVALGALEAVDAGGKRVLVGGPAEAAVRAARDRLTADAPGAAFDAVEPWLTSGTDGHPRTLVEASVLAAASTATRGRPDEASVHLRTALHRAGTDRVWGPVRDGGPTVVPLLERLARTDGPHQQDALALLDNARPGGDGASAGSLTEQEHVVLRFLPTLMSNPEIARAMHVSVNTVKTHLKGLYRKLGVERRRDAVIRARQLELL